MIYLIYACGALALIAAAFYARRVTSISVESSDPAQTAKFKEISGAISEGAMAFLAQEYKYVGLFALAFAGLMLVSLDDAATPINDGLFSSIAFLSGAFTSSLCAFLGMKIATAGNVRTAVRAQTSISEAFKVAFSSGIVMGFALVGLAVVAMMSIIQTYGSFIDNPHTVMDLVAGFGLGGSTVALFGRVGGGIYTKAADVGADLVGKVEAGIPEDDPRNPAVIADNVGDNVGDIAGMGADLFGSLAEATCAALVIGATAAAIAQDKTALLYPLLISAVGIPVCLITVLFARIGKDTTNVEPTLKKQLLISTLLMTVAMWIVTQLAMIDSFQIGSFTVTRTGVLVSLIAGLWSGLLIGYVTEYYTSHSYAPVRSIAKAS